jgi:hypothetical protein
MIHFNDVFYCLLFFNATFLSELRNLQSGSDRWMAFPLLAGPGAGAPSIFPHPRHWLPST